MKPRPEWCTKAPLSARVMLWLTSGKRIDGLWVGTYFKTNAGAVTLRIEEALRLIKVHDRLRYERLSKDLTRVWLRLVPGAVARCVPTMETCELMRPLRMPRQAPGTKPTAIPVRRANELASPRPCQRSAIG